MMRLKNKVAVITGAAGILGAMTAKRFLDEGARVVLVDLDSKRLETVAQQMNSDSVECVVADVTQSEQMKRVAEIAEQRFGPIDVFFANAGIEGTASQTMDAYPDELFDKVLEVNVRGVYVGIKSIMPRMNHGGSIMITSSIMGLMGTPFNVAYTASKHAVVGIRRSCAIIGGPSQIRVNTIHPGYVDSEMLDRLMNAHPEPETFRLMLEGKALFKRLTKPSDVANLALFLASDESSAITNQGLVVDCGTLN
jgi:NAD(P)-dependent dehydrogenase (short-subunit alcohol dehydrogenase family)